VLGDDSDSDSITEALVTFFGASDNDKINEAFVLRALKRLSKAAQAALDAAKREALSVGVVDYNAEYSDTLAALGAEHMSILARIAEIDQALAEHKAALAERVGVTALQIAWKPADCGFYIDSDTLKAKSGGSTIARDYSARKWEKTFQSLKDVKGPIVGVLSVTSKALPDKNGKGAEWNCTLTAASGEEYTSDSSSASGAGHGAMVALVKGEDNRDVSTKRWGVPAAFGIPEVVSSVVVPSSDSD